MLNAELIDDDKPASAVHRRPALQVVRSAARSNIALGSFTAMGGGAAAGAWFGSLGGPLAWLTVPAGAIIGGGAAGLGAGYGLNTLQNYALERLPLAAERLGLSERQQKLDVQYHDLPYFLGGLAPFALTMKPWGAPANLPANATSLQRIMAHPLTQRGVSGAMMGGWELGSESVSGEGPNWGKGAVATGFGVLFPHPTRIGATLQHFGAAPVQGALRAIAPQRAERLWPTVGAPAPGAPPEAPPAAAPAPAAAAPTVAGPPVTARDFTGEIIANRDAQGRPIPPLSREAEAVGAEIGTKPPPAKPSGPPAGVEGAPPVTAANWRAEMTERDRQGRPYPPTVADAADLGVMGPGVTEETFLGSHQRSPEAEQSARGQKQMEISVIGPEVAPDIHIEARRTHPEVFAELERLQAQRAELARWIEEANNPPESSLAEATERRDALQRELDAHVAGRGGYTGGPEARRLRAQVRDAQREIDALNERRQAFEEGRAEQTADLVQARKHLLDTDYALRDLKPQVTAAYRAAAERLGTEVVRHEPTPESIPAATEPQQAELPGTEAAIPPRQEPTSAEPAVSMQAAPEPPKPAPPTAPAPKPIEAQILDIAANVSWQLVRAGVQKVVADIEGAFVAARYKLRAAIFPEYGGPEALYRRESAEILGPGQRSKQAPLTPAAPRAARKVHEEKLSLLPFIARNRGLSIDDPMIADARAIFGGKNPLTPFGPLFQKGGMTLDRAREAAVEAGYIQEEGRGGTENRGGGTTTVKTLLDAIRNESAGRKVYRPGAEPQAEIDLDYEEYLRGQELAQHPARQIPGLHLRGVAKEMTVDVPAAEEEESRLLFQQRNVSDYASDYPRMLKDLGPQWEQAVVIDQDGNVVHNPVNRESIGGPAVRINRDGTLSPGIIAFHGSPHDFGKFDLSKIGTGEGAQAYGHGLYFAESENVGETYKTAISGNKNFFTTLSTDENNALPPDLNRDFTSIDADDARKYIQHIRNSIEKRATKVRASLAEKQDAALERGLAVREAQLAAMDKLLASGNFETFKPTGRLYQVTLKADPEQFLDWDKPLSEQSEHVQKRLREMALKDTALQQYEAEIARLKKAIETVEKQTESPTQQQRLTNLRDSLRFKEEYKPAFGSEIYKELGQGRAEDASAKLRELGIPGIRYLDQSSRGGAQVVLARQGLADVQRRIEETNRNMADWGDYGPKRLAELETQRDALKKTIAEGESKNPTHNYVIFDHDLVDITHKDGTPVPREEREGIVDALTNKGEGEKELFQRQRGVFSYRTPEEIAAGQRPTLQINAEANISTPAHEFGHQFLFELSRDAAHPDAPQWLKDDWRDALKWMGVKDEAALLEKTPKGKLTADARRAHERFARGYEAWRMEGRAPSAALARVFHMFAQFLRDLYKNLAGLERDAGMKIGLTDRMREVYGHLFETPEDMTVIAPDREASPGRAEIHAEDAARADPAEAEPGKARVDAEWSRGADEIPSDIADKFAAESIAFAAQNEPAGPELGKPQPGGEAGGEPGGPRPVPEASGIPEPAAARGGAGAELRAEHPGVNRPGGEGDRLEGRGQDNGGHAEQDRHPAGRAGAARETVTDARAHLDNQPLAPNAAPTLNDRGSFNVGKNGNIRTENITSVEQFERAIEEAKDRIPGTDEPMTDGQVMDAAKEMGFDPHDLTLDKLVRAFGGIRDLNKKVLAFRMAVRDQAETVGDLMRRIRDEGESDALVEAYAKERTRFDMMMSVLSSVSTEWGRAGRSFRSLDGWDEVMRLGLTQGVKSFTGRDLFQLKLEAKLGATLDTPAKVARFLRDAQKRSFGGMLLEYWINNLISGPATHMTYMVGNRITMLMDAVPETLVAAGIGRIRSMMGRQGEYVLPGETWQQVRAIGTSLPKSLQGALEAIQTGQPTLLPGQTARPLTPFYGDVGLHLARNIQNAPVTWHEFAADFFAAIQGVKNGIVGGAALVAAGGHAGAPVVGAHYSPLGQIPDVAIKGVPVLPVGSLVRLPGRAISAIHSFDTIANYSRYIAAKAYRDGVMQGLDGAALNRRIADRMANPPKEWMQEGHKESYAATLMGPGGNFMKRLSTLFNYQADLPVLGLTKPLKFVSPFIHIAGNVIEQAALKRTPLGILSSEIRADLSGANGNVRQDYAMARMLTGTALAVGYGTLAMEGYVTGSGPSDPHQAALWREVYQPHSVRIGDMWYQANRLGPLGMHLGIAADMYNVAHDLTDGEMLTAAAHLMHAITQNILDESFMRGPAELIKALDDPGRYGEGYIRNMVGSFVPFSVGMYQMNRAADPYTRQARTVMDAIKQRIPGQSQTLQPRISAVDGEEIPSPDAFGHAGFSAIYMKRVNTDPVRRAMLDLGIAPAPVPRSIRNVDLTDDEYTEFARTAGRLQKLRLDAIVGSLDWQRWPPHLQHDDIVNIIKQSREIARGRMMARYPHIPHDAVEALREKRTEAPEPIR